MDFSLLGLWAQMGVVAKGVVIILMLMSMYSIGITVERHVAPAPDRVPRARARTIASRRFRRALFSTTIERAISTRRLSPPESMIAGV